MKKTATLTLFISPTFDYLQSIPKGSVVTYGMVAKKCGLTNARNVSWILRQNTDPDRIPCYKVICADGSLADGYVFGGRKEQQRRLTEDGVHFDESGKVVTKHFLLM